ncbi:MAG: hypothetical protein ABI151_00070 [Chitinophagaceae bacterium]
MNHFELYKIPLSFRPDQDLLTARHKLLARDPELVKQADQGFEILRDADSTLEYVLQIKGLLNRNEIFEPDPQFRLEVSDINEELMELEMDEKQEQLMNVEQKTNRLLLKIIEDVAAVMDNYEEDTGTEEALLQVKDFYQQKKYLEGILDRIRGVRNIASPS